VSDAPKTTPRPPVPHRCPRGCSSTLTAAARVDSDDRIWSSWLYCPKCGWRSDALQAMQDNKAGAQPIGPRKIYIVEFSGYDDAEANAVFDAIERLSAESGWSGVLGMRTEDESD
jgi:hypothetical protein